MVELSGLEACTEYSIGLRISLADNIQYRYINDTWISVGEFKAVQKKEAQIFTHPSSPNSGRFWMKNVISFKTIKITHDAKSMHGDVRITSSCLLTKHVLSSFFALDYA